jgi:hypothetical protein
VVLDVNALENDGKTQLGAHGSQVVARIDDHRPRNGKALIAAKLGDVRLVGGPGQGVRVGYQQVEALVQQPLLVLGEETDVTVRTREYHAPVEPVDHVGEQRLRLVHVVVRARAPDTEIGQVFRHRVAGVPGRRVVHVAQRVNRDTVRSQCLCDGDRGGGARAGHDGRNHGLAEQPAQPFAPAPDRGAAGAPENRTVSGLL